MNLVDAFGRRIEYLRLSVTDRCNYRCFYCMPATGVPHGTHDEFLRHEELARLVRIFAGLGVHKVRLTGGEPLVRKGIVDLAGMIGAVPGIADLSLSTNGHLLERFALPLREAGVRRVNVSLDSLDPVNFHRITRGGHLQRVIRGIDTARGVGLHPVKLNMVVLKGVNDHEIEGMFDFALRRRLHLRFIETMPVGEAGIRGMEHYYPADAILARVRNKAGAELIPVKGAPGAGPARCYRVGAGPATIGVIAATSRHFCEGCNRVRLTAKGDLVLCLGQDNRVSLGAALRAGASDGDIKNLIVEAIARKPQRHHFDGQGEYHPIHRMSLLGG